VKRLVVCCLGLALLALSACSSPPPTPKNPKNPVVVLDTTFGKIYLEVWEDKAPVTAKNFLRYVDEQFYDGLVFHRVISNFMIQGGGFTPGLASEKKTHEAIANESASTPPNKRGTLAMARLNEPDSATAQFFINVQNNPDLDFKNGKAGYATFGEVLEGMDVVDEIRYVRTGRLQGQQDVPVNDVVIYSARRVETKK
jgi:peptidyl-prolyl cis-trans isomerase B (cyclophilin B)